MRHKPDLDIFTQTFDVQRSHDSNFKDERIKHCVDEIGTCFLFVCPGTVTSGELFLFTRKYHSESCIIDKTEIFTNTATMIASNSFPDKINLTHQAYHLSYNRLVQLNHSFEAHFKFGSEVESTQFVRLKHEESYEESEEVQLESDDRFCVVLLRWVFPYAT